MSGSTNTVEPSTTNVVTSIISASSVTPTTNIITSVVTQSAVSNGVTDTNPVTVIVTSVNTQSSVTNGGSDTNLVTITLTTVSTPSPVLYTSVYTSVYTSTPGASTSTASTPASLYNAGGGEASGRSAIGGGVIAGIVIGVLAALALTIGFGFFFVRRRRRLLGRKGSATDDITSPYEKDGQDIKELHGNAIMPEADGRPLHELPVHPSELEGDGPDIDVQSPVEMGMKSASGTISKPLPRTPT